MQQSADKKAKRLNPVIEERKARFDREMAELTLLRKKKIDAVSIMRRTQKEYLEGVSRLNEERSSNERIMLEALEIGLDNVKNLWMKLYQDVLDIEKMEKDQIELMSRAHRELEAIQTLQTKYKNDWIKEQSVREQKLLDEHALRKFFR
jgi:flagellar biosynthesis chaperone FliJ